MKKQIWIIADTHLGHDNIVKYCNRPENHNELILARIEIIKERDILIHLGDFCIGRDEFWHEEFFRRIPNTKRVLVLGNHDKKSKNWYLRNGWDFACKEFKNCYFGKDITFSHLPVKNPQNINIHGHYHNNLQRLLAKKYVVEGEKERNDKDFPLENYNPKLHKLLCIEDKNYKPILLETFLEKQTAP